jgi:phage gp45-like
LNKAFVTLASKDDENYQTVQVEYFGKPVDVEVISQYGLCSNVPVNSGGFMFDFSGKNKAGIFNNQKTRFKGLKEWEVQIGNYQSESSIKFPEDKSILVDSKGALNISLADLFELVAAGDIKLNAGTSGKIAIGNSSAELLDICNQLLTALETTVVATALGPQPLSSVATITAIKTLLGLIKGTL